MHRSALVLALALSASGCSDDHSSVSEHVVLGDGGYALVEVEIPSHHDAEIVFSFDGAEVGEAFAVFGEGDEPPFHAGWFDLSPWMAHCERSLESAACQNVHSQNAGLLLGVARRESRPPVVRFSRDCEEDDEPCVMYYAIVAAEHGAERTVTVRVVAR